MKWQRYYTVFNAVWYQALWFTALLLRGDGLWLLAALLVVHFIFSPSRRVDALLLATCGLMGTVSDSLLTLFGVYVFDPPGHWLPIPLWLVGIWFGFACTLQHSFHFFMRRRWLGTVIIGVLAPFSYYAGVRFGAVEFGFERPLAMLVIGAAWTILLPVFSIIVQALKESGDAETLTQA